MVRFESFLHFVCRPQSCTEKNTILQRKASIGFPCLRKKLSCGGLNEKTKNSQFNRTLQRSGEETYCLSGPLVNLKTWRVSPPGTFTVLYTISLWDYLINNCTCSSAFKLKKSWWKNEVKKSKVAVSRNTLNSGISAGRFKFSVHFSIEVIQKEE